MSKKNNNAISDEELISALLQCGTIREAAAAVKTAPRTIYDRMKDREFKVAYMEAKNDILRKAVHNISAKLASAINTVAEIMTDTEVTAAVRLQAAQTIINNAEKFTARLTTDEEEAIRANTSVFDALQL